MITLKTLPDATAQQVFDQVAEHLLTQNKQCIQYPEMVTSLGPICSYRNPSGEKCAAGCLIGDDEYFPDKFEGRGWSNLVANKLIPNNHAWLIGMLQSIHDSHKPADWPTELCDVAEMYKLSTDIIKKRK